MKSKSYLFTYCYECDNHTLGFGSVTMTQSEYTPINQAVINDAIEWVRKEANMPADRKIAPLAFIRFEDEEETVEPTNADRIRSMTDEELAEWIFRDQMDIFKMACDAFGYTEYDEKKMERWDDILSWLRQESGE